MIYTIVFDNYNW